MAKKKGLDGERGGVGEEREVQHGPIGGSGIPPERAEGDGGKGREGKSRTAQDELVAALIGEAAVEDELPKGQTLQEHDRQHHPDGYHEGDECKFREKMATETDADKTDIANPNSAPKKEIGVSQEKSSSKTLSEQLKNEIIEQAHKFWGINDRPKAPNGEYSNLSLLNWCMVRTPTFKKWFGDWEKDPLNSSKVLDENGEPKIVYHGSTFDETGSFSETIKKSGMMRLPKGRFWTSDNFDVALGYTPQGEGEEGYDYIFCPNTVSSLEERSDREIIQDLYKKGYARGLVKKTILTYDGHLWKYVKGDDGKFRYKKIPFSANTNCGYIKTKTLLGEATNTDVENEEQLKWSMEDFTSLESDFSDNDIEEEIEEAFGEKFNENKLGYETVFEDNLGYVYKSQEDFEHKIAAQVRTDKEEEELEGVTGAIYPMFMNIRNPMIVDAEGHHYSDLEYDGKKVNSDSLATIADIKGYDGLIIKNVDDSADSHAWGYKGNDYCCRDAESQVRYAYRGQGFLGRLSDSDALEMENRLQRMLWDTKHKEYKELMSQFHPEKDMQEVIEKISKLGSREEMAVEFARIMESGRIEKDGSSGERKSIRSKSLVTPEEDAAYMEAAEKGDEKAVKRLFEKAAKRYLADSKVQSKVWHNTKKKFTEFRNNFPNVFFFAKDRKWADIFGKEERYSTKENTKPYYVRLGKSLDMRGERTGNEWLKFFEDNGIKLGEKGVEKLSKVGEETLPGWAILNHDMSEPDGPGFRDSMVAAGFDGAVFEDKKRGTADRTTYGVFNSNAIKSADPVTYDNEGNVIPLSRRFDDGDDIRGDVSSNAEYIEKMKSLHPNIDPEELIDRLKNLGSREEMEAEIQKILGKK